MFWQRLFLLKRLIDCRDGAAVLMPEYHNETRAQMLDGIFERADHQTVGKVAGHANDKELPESLNEDKLRNNAGIGTGEHGRKRRLSVLEQRTLLRNRAQWREFVGDEVRV